MPRTPRTQRRRHAVHPHEVWTSGDVARLDAVVAACALVAKADGWVTAREGRRMTDRMSRSPSIGLFGLHEVMVGFKALNIRIDRNPEDGEAAAEAAITALRGQPGPSDLLIDTACSVAEAEGGFDTEERDVSLHLCRLPDLGPARYDLVSGKGGAE